MRKKINEIYPQLIPQTDSSIFGKAKTHVRILDLSKDSADVIPSSNAVSETLDTFPPAGCKSRTLLDYDSARPIQRLPFFLRAMRR